MVKKYSRVYFRHTLGLKVNKRTYEIHNMPRRSIFDIDVVEIKTQTFEIVVVLGKIVFLTVLYAVQHVRNAFELNHPCAS